MAIPLLLNTFGGTPAPATSGNLALPLSGVVTLVFPWGIETRPTTTGVVDPNCRISGAVDPNCRISGVAGQV